MGPTPKKSVARIFLGKYLQIRGGDFASVDFLGLRAKFCQCLQTLIRPVPREKIFLFFISLVMRKGTNRSVPLPSPFGCC